MLFSMLLLGAMASIDPVRPAVFALVLLTRRQNALAFLAGWGVALSLLFGVAFIMLGGDATTPPSPAQRTGASFVLLVLGLALLLLSGRRRRRRRADVEREVVPDRLRHRLDGIDARRASLLGVLIQPRAITVAAALVCARDRTGTINLILGFAMFAVVSTGLLIGLLIYDARQRATSQQHLEKFVRDLGRVGPRLITIASAVAGLYLVVSSVLDLVNN